MACAVFSFTMIWYVVGSTLNKSEFTSPLWSATKPVVLSYVCIGILFVAIDLAAYISLGTAKGKVVRVALTMLLATAILGFFFFGDAESVKNFSLDMAVAWMMAHRFEISLVEVTGHIIALAIYYLSYRISCHFCDKGAY